MRWLEGWRSFGGVCWFGVAAKAEPKTMAVLVGGVKRALVANGSGRWMVAPALLAVLAVVVYPLTFATYYGFRKVLPGVEGEFVGLANYARLARDPAFAEALSTTLLFTAASAILSFLAGLCLALLLAKPFPGREAVAVAVFLPWVFPAVVVATFGRLALFDVVGVLNNVAETIGIAGAGSLLLDEGALLSVAVLADVWRGTPFVALLILAGMRTIPSDVYEAASVDGANSWQRFWRITLPLLSPTLLVVLLIRLLDAFRVFDLFRVLGDGSLKSLSTYVYQNVLLSQLNFGLGSAAAVFVFACALSVALLFALVLRAQTPTGLAHAGLNPDAAEETDGRADGRSGPWLGAVGVVVALAFLAPLAWVFWVSVDSAPGSGGAVTGPSLLTYSFVLYDGRLATGLVNSVVIAGATAALTLLLACPAAYAIARLGLRHANGLLGVMLAVAFFPPAAVLVPMLVQLREIGIVGTHLGAIVPHTAFFLPFAVWLLATFFRELPAEVEDAARLDGATRVQVLAWVILPLAAPAVLATGAFVFLLSWNELILAATFTLAESVRPVTVVLADLVAAARTSFPGPLAAASIIATLPPIVLFLAFRRRILAGLTSDAFGEAQPADPAHRRRSRTLLPEAAVWAATAALLLATLWAASLFVRHGLDALAFPYPLNYGEGPLLDQAVRLADFRNIYLPDLSEPPYAISSYPPLFALLQAPLVWLFGPELWYGRAISLAATVAVAVLIALTLHALTRDKIASAAGGLTFLAVPFVLYWSSLSRVDMLGLAFSWAGLYAVIRGPTGRRGVILASLLLVAAIYTRQSYALVAPLAAFAWLLGQRRHWDALALAAVTGGASLALLAALDALTGGGFFLHTVTSIINEFRWEQVTSYAADLQATVPILLVGAVAFLIVGLRSVSWWLVGPYLLGSGATAVLIGKIGSDFNYLLELSAALALAAGALLARYADSPRLRIAMLLALALQVTIMVQASQFFYAELQASVISQRSELERLEEIVATSEGPVLADEYAGLSPLDGRRIHIQPFEFSQLAREGKWDQQPFIESIRRGEFDAILIFELPAAPYLDEERWTPQMLGEIKSSYEPAETAANTTVYRPR